MRRFDLDFSGPEASFRAQTFLRAKITLWLDTPAVYMQDAVGPTGAERLRKISKALLNEIAPDDEIGWVDPRKRHLELQETASSQIETAVNLVKQRAKDPESEQEKDQARRFNEQVDRFRRWFENGRECGCPVCAKGHDPFEEHPVSFRNDDTSAVPTCLCRFVRETELARFFVEQLYGDLLPPGFVHAEVSFVPPATGQSTVNGTTLYRSRSSMRRTYADQGPLRTVDVSISLPLELDVEKLHSILYVAVHELGVHSVQQLGLPRAPNKDDTDPILVEGMVEAAIYDALAEVISAEKKNARFLTLEAYQNASRQRHLQHESPSGKGMTDPNDVSLGGESYGRLVRLANAAVNAGLIETDTALPDRRPILQLSRVLNGERWARRLVLALNLLPFNRKQQAQLFAWLEAEIEQFNPLELWLAELAELKAKSKLPPTDPLVRFLHLLKQISRNPHNKRFQNKLLRAMGAD